MNEDTMNGGMLAGIIKVCEKHESNANRLLRDAESLRSADNEDVGRVIAACKEITELAGMLLCAVKEMAPASTFMYTGKK